MAEALVLVAGGLTAASAAGSIMGGYQENAAYKAQAKQSELAARQEELKGREQATKIKLNLQSVLATQRAGFAARGITLNSGSVTNLSNQSSSQAAQDIETAQFGSAMSAEQQRAQGGQYRMAGRAAVAKGYATAAATVGQSLIPKGTG